jgi:hypothetical protein
MSRPIERRAVGWVTPAVSVLGGAALLAGAWIGGHPALGIVMFAIMVVFAAGTLVAARFSETVKGLLDRRDERITSIDLRATAASGITTIVAILAGAVVELSHGHSGAPFTWLAAVAGLTYLAAVAALRLRG